MFFKRYAFYSGSRRCLQKAEQGKDMKFCRLRQGSDGFLLREFRHGANPPPIAQHSRIFKLFYYPVFVV